MASGYKTGGRAKGTPNRRTTEASELLAKLGCDPIEGMARIAMNRRNPVELRSQMFKELAPYVYSKRKAVDELPAGEDFAPTEPPESAAAEIRERLNEIRRRLYGASPDGTPNGDGSTALQPGR